jgi:hypothetical protein
MVLSFFAKLSLQRKFEEKEEAGEPRQVMLIVFLILFGTFTG